MIKTSNPTIRTSKLPIGLTAPAREVGADVPKESNKSEYESTMLRELITTAGYMGGGAHLGEAEETQSSSCWAVGRIKLDLLQHNWTNSQSASENPRDSASEGFIGRLPLITAGTGVGATKWWNGRRPVRTWDG